MHTDHRPDEVLLAIGATIERLGAANAAGEISLDDATAQLLAADPTLSPLGARGQLGAWRTARSRYEAAVANRHARITGPADARALRARAAITFTFPRKVG